MKLLNKTTFGAIGILFALLFLSSLIIGIFFVSTSFDKDFWRSISLLSLASFFPLTIFALLMDIRQSVTKSTDELKKLERYGLILTFSGSLYEIALLSLLIFLSIFINHEYLLSLTPIFGISGFIIMIIGIILIIATSKSKNDKNNF